MEALQKARMGFWSLRNAPSELWKAYILKFLDSYSYFSFSIIFTLFLSNDFGYSDVAAGTLYGAWGALVTVYGILAGPLVDNLGVAKSLRLGFILSLLSRLLICFTTSRTILVLNVCGLLPMANCLGIPVLTTGIRRYTDEANRGFAFGLFYVVMNIAALLSGPIVDFLTIYYKQNEPNNGAWSLTNYRAIILTGMMQLLFFSGPGSNSFSCGQTGIAANILACLVALTVREIKVESLSRKDSEAQITDFQVSRASPWSILRETVRTKAFWRFLTVCLITVNVRMIFRHLDATLPKYMLREFGENVPKGSIYSINPAIIIVLVPIVTAATTTIDPLVMIHHGSYISAFSVFILVLSTSIPACVLFVAVLSVGESIWSPRLYDYTMAVVSEGREGTYMALSSAPLFLAKLPVGFLSGILLERYCPKDGERHSKTMWLIIGLTTIVSPVLLSCCWGYISRKDDNEEQVQYYRTAELRVIHDTADGPSNETSSILENRRPSLT